MRKVGLAIAALFCAILADRATAQDRYEWPGMGAIPPSWVELRPVEGQEHVAEVVFHNTVVHGGNTDFTLSIDGLTVSGHLEWQAGGTQAERIRIETPPDYLAYPESVTVEEDGDGTILIYRMEGVGA